MIALDRIVSQELADRAALPGLAHEDHPVLGREIPDDDLLPRADPARERKDQRRRFKGHALSVARDVQPRLPALLANRARPDLSAQRGIGADCRVRAGHITRKRIE